MKNTEINKNIPLRFLEEVDLKAWRKTNAKLIIATKKSSDIKTYRLMLRFTKEINQELYLTEQEAKAIIDYYKINDLYAQTNFEVWIKLKKGVGEEFGKTWTAFDLVVVPTAVFFERQFITSAVQYRLLKIDNIPWEIYEKAIAEAEINYNLLVTERSD